VKAAFSRVLGSRQGGTLLLAASYLILGTILRLGLLIFSASAVSWGLSTVGALVIGFFFDVLMASLLTLPFGLLSACWPSWAWARSWLRAPLYLAWVFGCSLFVFWKVSEVLFWEEFGVRFNFIAVDYLVYTQEVVKNIKESYPMAAIVTGILLAVGVIVFAWIKTGWWKRWQEGAQTDMSPRWRSWVGLLLPLFLCLALAYTAGRRDLKASSRVATSMGERITAGLRHMGEPQPSWANNYDAELAKNGEYAFLAAFWANQLEWQRFYPSRPEAVAGLRAQLARQGVPLAKDESKGVKRHIIAAPGPGRRLNVIQITVESLSAEYLSCYGQSPYAEQRLTPVLDRIAQESLWFRHCYASGTRTVRGMEALTLAIPPIPGQSVLRRAKCEDLTTLGSVLAAQGYDNAFIYGGDGFFDNMNYFFENNGYRIVDQPVALKAGEKMTFGNAWGACDEDAFNWSLHEADKAFASQKPFHHFVMTTSNHRPYTWPAGKIDDKLVGREGGVAYTDYAIGAFLKAAESKPWFKDTIFIVVADHCASVAGKRDLEIRKYEIPLFIWAPGLVAPRREDKMMSQVDLAPTVLGLLHATYVARFVGSDIFSPTYQPRAFISNYQKVAVLREDGLLTVLKPVKQVVQYQADLATGALVPLKELRPDAVDEAIFYYQGTDELFNQGGLANPSR